MLKDVAKIDFILLITQDCNLACTYCYISKRPAKMTKKTAEKIVNFIFKHANKDETNHIGFFGGEPLLEFTLMKKIVELVKQHAFFNKFSIKFNVITNGTIFTDEIADFLIKHDITFSVSCDGNAQTQNITRRFKNGANTSDIVDATIKRALLKMPVLVSAVYTPKTIQQLPETIRHLMALGLRQIYITAADFSTKWCDKDVDTLEAVLGDIADIYMNAYRQKRPVFINVIDEKISTILRDGFFPAERCHMGKKKFAFSPEGNIFLCDRIVYDGNPESPHCIGNVKTGIDSRKMVCKIDETDKPNNECLTCTVEKYCMHWCGCTNFHSTGYYNRVGAFLCAKEKIAIKIALHILETLEVDIPATFSNHQAGLMTINAWNWE